MSMRQGFQVLVRAVALCSAFTAQAEAAEIAPRGFAAPVYDGVVPGPSGDPLTNYRFRGGQDWPAIRLSAPVPLDWSHAGALALPVENPADIPFELLLRIDDRADANGDDRSLTGTIDIPPHARGTVLLPLDAAPLGMVARPPSRTSSASGDLLVRQVRGALDLAHVVALHVSGVRMDTDQWLLLGPIGFRAWEPTPRGPIVDAFGQAIEGQWPEKISSGAELKVLLRQAEAQTRALARTLPATTDRYDDVDPGTRLAATSFFRIKQTNGRWTLVTPAGHRFFSLGVDSVAPSMPTRVEGRRGLFAWLPREGDPLFQYGVPAAGEGELAAFDFGEANLDRSLGPGWRQPWTAQAIRRLKAWGFNTLGNWSAADVTDAGSLPHVEFYDVEGDSAKVAMPGGRALSDPFDPRFAAVADEVAATMTAAHRADPWLLGYFSGNELPWGSEQRPEQGIMAQVFALGSDSPARRAMIEGLRRRYGTSAAFASAWGTGPVESWEAFSTTSPPWPARLTPEARRDIADFQKLFATLYFRTAAEAIRRHDPHHLYLGTRFADAPPEVVEACARFCDVMSFNVYGRVPGERAAAWSRFDRPVLIGEFHFGSTDRGSFWGGMVDVGHEAERGPAYAAYLAAAVEDPDIVGCHWYQYADEPLTGRPYDGENGHIGLVAVTGVPYAGFVADVAAANAKATARFVAQAKPDLRGSQ